MISKTGVLCHGLAAIKKWLKGKNAANILAIVADDFEPPLNLTIIFHTDLIPFKHTIVKVQSLKSTILKLIDKSIIRFCL